MRTSEEKFPIVEDWLQSGLTQKVYSQRRNLPLHILPYRASRYQKTNQDPIVQFAQSSSGHFNPVSNGNTINGGMEIVLPTVVVIRFADPVSVSYLQQLLKVCFCLSHHQRFFLFTQAVDMRKGFDRLSGMVQLF